MYRGQAIPELQGVYIYADFCSGQFGSLKIRDQRVVGQRDITSVINPDHIDAITSFGLDGAGEIYVLSSAKSTVYRIDGG